MKKYPESQLDFLNDHPVNRPGGPAVAFPLVVELDHRTWMRFLSEEWLFPKSSSGILLGVNKPCDESVPSDFIAVSVCFDLGKLPNSNVMVWREGSWVNISLRGLEHTDEAVIWNGPLPLFAVDCFRVATPENRAHLLGQVRLFADMELPSQPVEVTPTRKIELAAPKRATFPFGEKRAPQNWDLLRGAAAMALECVPAIGPWLQVLCDMFIESPSSTSANAVAAPWLSRAPWNFLHGRDCVQEAPLWTAIIEVLSDTENRINWRPDIVLHSVCDRAREIGGNMDRLLYLENATEKLLKDIGGIQELGIKDDNLELGLQLLLLRHTPDRFVSWKKDLPSIAPGAWWTGAILAGYLCGYRALPLALRGGFEARKFISLRTWYLADKKSSSDWVSDSQAIVNWVVEDDRFNVISDNRLIASHKMSSRGRWHELNYIDPFFREHAENVARQFCPELIKRILVLNKGDYTVSRSELQNIKISQDHIHIPESIEIVVGELAEFQFSLDINSFRKWLATASLQTPIPNPPATSSTARYDNLFAEKHIVQVVHSPVPAKTNAYKKTKVTLETAPSGLRIINNFITSREESSILASIEKSVWDTSMSRRVQHYGWRYDYKAKRIDSSAYLGPLPAWAESIARKLVQGGHLATLPDQVIVNEYTGNQGIAKHIDCKSCFLGAVVTISLLESWEMIFSRKSQQGPDLQYKVILNRRSATILDGESRSDWLHEIPKRTKEAGILRERRISITFRKVHSPPLA